jgi:hypothetical protein
MAESGGGVRVLIQPDLKYSIKEVNLPKKQEIGTILICENEFHFAKSATTQAQ